VPVVGLDAGAGPAGQRWRRAEDATTQRPPSTRDVAQRLGAVVDGMRRTGPRRARVPCPSRWTPGTDEPRPGVHPAARGGRAPGAAPARPEAHSGRPGGCLGRHAGRTDGSARALHPNRGCATSTLPRTATRPSLRRWARRRRPRPRRRRPPRSCRSPTPDAGRPPTRGGTDTV